MTSLLSVPLKTGPLPNKNKRRKFGGTFVFFCWAPVVFLERMVYTFPNITLGDLHMKKLIALMMLLPVLILPARAGEVKSMVEELPAVSVLQEMDMDSQRQVYDHTQAAYDAYMALSEEEKAELGEAEETFEALFGYFNTLIAPAEEAPEEAGNGSQLLSTVIACLLGIFLAQKIITGRNLK